MIVTLGFTVSDTGAGLDALQAAGLAVQSISTNYVSIGDNENEDAVRLAAWQYSDAMMAWREQRDAELLRVVGIMRRDQSQKYLGMTGLTNEQILAWEQYAQALRDGLQTVKDAGQLLVWS